LEYYINGLHSRLADAVDRSQQKSLFAAYALAVGAALPDSTGVLQCLIQMATDKWNE